MNEPLRVMLLVTNLGIGGAQRQVIELARGLDRSRFEPTVVTVYSGHPLEQDLLAAGDVRLLSLDRRHKLDVGSLPKLVSLLRRERTQIVQPYMTPAAFFGLTAAWLARTPLRIATERNGAYAGRPGAGARLYAALERRFVHSADAVVPNSQAGRRHLQSQGVPPEKVRVIYNGIGEGRFAIAPGEAQLVRDQLRIPADGRVVGIVGRLDDAKDHETFLNAVPIVLSLEPDAWFVIVGEGHRRWRLEARAAELGVAERVRFAGNQTRIAPYIANFDVSVLSSCDDEGCSNFVLESMAMGKPVVCTDIGGNREVVSNGRDGIIVPVRHAPALARAIAEVLLDSELALSLAQAGRATFEQRFSQAEMVSEYERLYEELWAAYEARQAAGAGRVAEAQGD
ncbi:MAG TPA: glycosyltransferase [Dehalococcoidia bacterium]|nr:glycosyltransferase [Dehalococcoidia bacterium]